MGFTGSVQLNNQGYSCSIERHPNVPAYVCDIKPAPFPASFIPYEIIKGTRPAVCESKEEANGHAMTKCAYEYHDMKKCGCHDLDPNKNPELWHDYVHSVQNAILSRLDQNEITIEFFASGYLLQEFQILNQLFSDERIKSWKGTLNLQFIDTKYDPNQINWKLGVPAIILGIVSVSCFYYAATTKDDGKRYTALLAGIISIVFTITLGLEAQKAPIMKTIDQFIKETAALTPFSIRANFSNQADLSPSKNNTCDVLIGNDIENTRNIFENIRNMNLKPNGQVILVTKEGSNDSIQKVMRQATGPDGHYTQRIYT